MNTRTIKINIEQEPELQLVGEYMLRKAGEEEWRVIPTPESDLPDRPHRLTWRYYPCNRCDRAERRELSAIWLGWERVQHCPLCRGFGDDRNQYFSVL